MAHPRRWRVLHDLREAGVQFHRETRVLEIAADRIRFESIDSETPPEEWGVDNVVIATGLVANPECVESLRSAGVPLVVIGDAKGMAYLDGAIEQGFKAAIEIG
jgi:NADH dehydrogenase FAD-containing subunit